MKKIAIDLINSFLQVKLDRRVSASKALNHLWFNEVIKNKKFACYHF